MISLCVLAVILSVLNLGVIGVLAYKVIGG